MERETEPGRVFAALPRRYGVLALVWSALILGSLLWDMRQESAHTLDIAAAAARADIGKDLIFRKWAASHGGVYVTPTEHTPPNPYLKVPERDVVTTTGKPLTLMNPAYMLREMQNDFPGEYGTRSHLTSLKLLNPNNVPDAWETEALQAFERGEKERLEIEQINGQPYLRMMRPMIAEKGCLKCHAIQGYKEGDIRGGLSTTVPLASFLARERESVREQAWTHGMIWLIGLAGLGLSYRRERRQVAEYEQVENQLRRNSLYTRSLIEASLDPLVTISVEGKITDVNRATEQATGRGRGELVGTDFSDYFTEPDKARDGYRKVFQEGFVTDYPLAIRNKDGRIMDVLYNASVYRDESGNVLGVFAAARDITERKKAEDELREKEERLALATIQNGVGVWDWNLVTQKMIWDDSMFALYRIRREDFIGTEEAWRASLHPDDLERGDREVGEAIAGIRPFDTSFRVVWPNGEIHYIKAVAKVFRDEQGKPLRMLGTNMDITELKLAEQKVHELNRELEQRVAERTAQLEATNKELEAFSYSVSHDLRAPLRAIDGFSRILLDEYGNRFDGDGQHLLNVVRDNALRMGQLIDDILQFSRSGRLEMNPAKIDMEALAHEVLDELLRTASSPKLQVEIGRLPQVGGDRAMLRQVFVNLLSNAIKFSHNKDAPRVEVVGSIEGGEAVYCVKDNGAGFDMQYADRLFGVFQRLHSMSEFEGTGIGLAIVKRIVTRHGGRVWAEGKPGEGARFCFSLPSGADGAEGG